MRSKELTTLGIALVIPGIVFGEDWLVGYSFIVVGILLSIVSMIQSRRKVRDAKSSGRC